MEERPLNWKTIFKDILLPDKSKEESNFALQNAESKPQKTVEEHLDELHDFSVETNSSKLEDSSFIGSESEIISWECKNSSAFSERSHTCKIFESRNESDVPEWNKVFKEILGGKSSDESKKRDKNIKIQNVTDVNQIRFFKKKITRPVHKSKKVIEEESSINEIFALSRSFKAHTCTFKLNDFDGAGIDVFKTDKEIGSKECLCSSFSLNDDNSYSSSFSLNDESRDDFIPLKGKVSISVLSVDLVTASSPVEITEFWDDEL